MYRHTQCHYTDISGWIALRDIVKQIWLSLDYGDAYYVVNLIRYARQMTSTVSSLPIRPREQYAMTWV